MGASVMAVLPYLSAGASVLSGISGAMAAKGQAEDAAAQAAFTRRQAEGAAQDEMIASTQEEAERRRELNSTLSTIEAMRAARGLRASPSGDAYTKNIGKIGADNIRVGKLNRLTRAVSYKQQAAFAAQQGKSALKAGQIGMATSLLSGAASGFSSIGGSSIFKSYQPGISPTQKLKSGETVIWR